MNDLSECLSTFLNCLNEYPEPETVELSSLLAALAKDLEVHRPPVLPSSLLISLFSTVLLVWEIITVCPLCDSSLGHF